MIHYSKKSQCNDDYHIINIFKEQYRKDESFRNVSIKEFKHLLDHFDVTLKEKFTIVEAEKMQSHLDSVPSAADLEKFSFDAV
jgi:ribosomal protein L7/L12